MKKFILLSLVLISCAQPTKKNSFISSINGNEYVNLIDEETKAAEYHVGLYNIFKFKVTRLTPELHMAILKKKAYDNEWSEQKFRKERLKIQDKVKEQAEFFLSFFAAKSKHDDLDDLNSIWNIYLEVGGKKYKGKVQKLQGHYSVWIPYFQHHTKFNTPYQVTFPVPIEQIQNQTARFIITGALGSRSVTF